MSATNHTPNLNLSQFIPLDKPAWLGDYNSDMSKIDTAVHKVQTQADSMETAVEQATTAAQAATQAAQAATEAAQDAADKAQDAETTANNVSSSATQALTVAQQAQAAVAGKVDKAGDTMTGPLTVSVINSKTTGSQITLNGSPKEARMVSGGIGFWSIDNPGSKTSDNYLGIYKDSTGTPHINAGNMDINDLKDPTEAQDAATKAYVDAHGGRTKTGNAALLTKVSGTSSRAPNLVGGVSFVTENYGNLLGYLTISATVNANEIICTFRLPSGKTLDTAYSTCYLVGFASNNLQITPLSFTPAGQIISCYSSTSAMNTGNYLVIGQVFAN